MRLAILLALSALVLRACSILPDGSVACLDIVSLTPRPDLVRVGPPGFRPPAKFTLRPKHLLIAGALGAADAASSIGMYELNPVLGRGSFGARQAVVKGAITGSALFTAWKIRKEHPRLAWAIVVISGASSAFGAGHNLTIRWGNR